MVDKEYTEGVHKTPKGYTKSKSGGIQKATN